ncbi:3-demethylubiquinone-9 3-methyltransferase [Pedobacter lusitanus]|uniref:3-demethylubiquinone-9 3-methyltransferase n=1 Tax=Pedobacter lusitanus TaxID=1503925 RepID=A0A0D0GEV7_9SPHI|nr:VOC family protein [Pedobacter lusitanus]KIO75812.1 3-demethylubiquinone-9 3-methyltransferase [Pedobacter lusitanus]
MKKITPFLWFNDNLEEAIHFYTSIFNNSVIQNISYQGEPDATGKSKVMSATFHLDGQDFMGMNGGPLFSFTPAISLFVNCHSQEEIDGFWEKLSEGGEKSRCGWLKDKFGLSWQIVPSDLGKLLRHQDPEKAARVMAAMLKMDKLDMQALRDA